VDDPEEPFGAGTEIAHEVITIRPTTTTRAAIRITVSQRVANNGEIAVATAVLSGKIDAYYEKPEIMEDVAIALINAAYIMRKLNKRAVGK
jgi:hypothetical protein